MPAGTSSVLRTPTLAGVDPVVVESKLTPPPVTAGAVPRDRLFDGIEESLVDGRDIARSQRRRWPIARADAKVAVGGFVLAVMEAMDPAGFVHSDDAAGFSAVYEFRIRGATRIYLVFDDGTLKVEGSRTGPVDVHVSAEPAAFLLTSLSRTSPLRYALTGRMVVWGRRPWLMARLGHLLRGP